MDSAATLTISIRDGKVRINLTYPAGTDKQVEKLALLALKTLRLKMQACAEHHGTTVVSRKATEDPHGSK
jgi:hypothetical protein